MYSSIFFVSFAQSYKVTCISIIIEFQFLQISKRMLSQMSQWSTTNYVKIESTSSILWFVELFKWVCAVSSTHRYGRVSDLLSGRQTTHAAQRTAKSTLTYELGTGEVPSSLLPFCFYTPTSRRRKSKRTVYSLRSWLSATFSPSFTTGSRVIRSLFHRTSHPWPSSFFKSITSPSCVSFRLLLVCITTAMDEK